MIEGKFKAEHFVPEVYELAVIRVPICVTLMKKINFEKEMTTVRIVQRISCWECFFSVKMYKSCGIF